MLSCVLLDLYACIWPFFCSPSQPSLSVLSRSNWDTASHCCGNFLFGHGFLRRLFQMMRVSPDWKRLHGHRLAMDSTLWWHANPCCGTHQGLHNWWNRFDYCGPMWKMDQCCPLLVTGYGIPSLNIVCTLQTWRTILKLWHRGEQLLVSFCRVMLLVVYQHPIIIYIEGCRRSKGCVCVIPCTCIQPQISCIYFEKRYNQ